MDLASLSKKITEAVDLRKTLKYKGMSFEIGLLTADEERKVNNIVEKIREAQDAPGLADRMDSLKRITAAYAIRSINGEEVPKLIDVPVEGTTETKPIPRAEALADHLRQLPAALTTVLYSAVTDLRRESNSKLDEQVEYDWFESPDLLEEDEEEQAALAAAEAAEAPVKLVELAEKDATDTDKALEAQP